jgi:hypothetical protein
MLLQLNLQATNTTPIPPSASPTSWNVKARTYPPTQARQPHGLVACAQHPADALLPDDPGNSWEAMQDQPNFAWGPSSFLMLIVTLSGTAMLFTAWRAPTEATEDLEPLH